MVVGVLPSPPDGHRGEGSGRRKLDPCSNSSWGLDGAAGLWKGSAYKQPRRGPYQSHTVYTVCVTTISCHHSSTEWHHPTLPCVTSNADIPNNIAIILPFCNVDFKLHNHLMEMGLEIEDL